MVTMTMQGTTAARMWDAARAGNGGALEETTSSFRSDASASSSGFRSEASAGPGGAEPVGAGPSVGLRVVVAVADVVDSVECVVLAEGGPAGADVVAPAGGAGAGGAAVGASEAATQSASWGEHSTVTTVRQSAAR